MAQKYKIVFYAEEDAMVTITENEYKAIVSNWEKVTAFEVNGELISRSSIKRIVKFGRPEFTQIMEPEPKPISKELMEEIRNKHIK